MGFVDLLKNTFLEKVEAEQPRLHVGGIPIPIKNEPLGLAVIGSPGSGKTQVINGNLSIIRARGERAIIADAGGEAMSGWGKASDLILNPFDERTVNISPLAEMTGPWDADLIARAIIPDGEGADKQWNEFGQRLLSAVLRRFWELSLPESEFRKKLWSGIKRLESDIENLRQEKAGVTTESKAEKLEAAIQNLLINIEGRKKIAKKNRPTNGDLLHYLTVAPIWQLEVLVEGLPAATLFDESIRKMLGSIRGIIGTNLQPFDYLDRNAGVDGFSLKKWVNNDESQDWLWLPYREDMAAAMRPLLRYVTEITSTALLARETDLKRRFWFVADEFHSLGRCDQLIQLVTKGRKKGASLIAGFQAVAQLEELYGKTGRDILKNCLQNWIALRVADAATAKWLEAESGNQVIQRTEHSTTTNNQGSSESETKRRSKEEVIIYSQFQTLKDLTGFLKLAGPWPIALVQIQIAKPRGSVSSFRLKNFTSGTHANSSEVPEQNANQTTQAQSEPAIDLGGLD